MYYRRWSQHLHQENQSPKADQIVDDLIVCVVYHRQYYHHEVVVVYLDHIPVKVFKTSKWLEIWFDEVILKDKHDCNNIKDDSPH